MENTVPNPPVQTTAQATPPPPVNTYIPSHTPEAPTPKYMNKKLAIALLALIGVSLIIGIVMSAQDIQRAEQKKKNLAATDIPTKAITMEQKVSEAPQSDKPEIVGSYFWNVKRGSVDATIEQELKALLAKDNKDYTGGTYYGVQTIEISKEDKKWGIIQYGGGMDETFNPTEIDPTVNILEKKDDTWTRVGPENEAFCPTIARMPKDIKQSKLLVEHCRKQ